MWKIEAIEVSPILEGYSNVVIILHWRYDLVVSGTVEESVYGSVALEKPSIEFIPVNELTSEIVFNWLFENINKTAIENKLQSDYDSRASKPIVFTTLPWET